MIINSQAGGINTGLSGSQVVDEILHAFRTGPAIVHLVAGLRISYCRGFGAVFDVFHSV